MEIVIAGYSEDRTETLTLEPSALAGRDQSGRKWFRWATKIGNVATIDCLTGRWRQRDTQNSYTLWVGGGDEAFSKQHTDWALRPR